MCTRAKKNCVRILQESNKLKKIHSLAIEFPQGAKASLRARGKDTLLAYPDFSKEFDTYGRIINSTWRGYIPRWETDRLLFTQTITCSDSVHDDRARASQYRRNSEGVPQYTLRPKYTNIHGPQKPYIPYFEPTTSPPLAHLSRRFFSQVQIHSRQR